jgi:hypothetical protein
MSNFGSLSLKLSRQDAKKAGLKIGKLSTYKVKSMCGKGGDNWYEVYEDSNLVWQGRADCASQAKANYLENLIAPTRNPRALARG